MTKPRCDWANGSDLYAAYHDKEWGVPVYDDQTLFEFLLLESAQAGLSWLTVLKKRQGYRSVFYNFNPTKVASMSQEQVEAALTNPGIVRNRRKVLAAVTNAQVFLAIQQQYGSFSSYLWSFVGNTPITNNYASIDEVPTTSPESDKLSQDLKARGMSFVGSTIMYAYMQAVGMVNDHTTSCFRHSKV